MEKGRKSERGRRRDTEGGGGAKGEIAVGS